MRAVVIIPARYKSSRFPGKPLVSIAGKPMIQWVCELSESAVGRDNVYVATDHKKIKEAVEDSGYQVVMTSSECLTGTDRLAEAVEKIEADIYVNVQGDEPLVKARDIQKVIKSKAQFPDSVINGYCKIGANEDPLNVNIPKVIFTEDGRLVYISRQALPGCKDSSNAPSQYYKQVCIYAYSREDLLEFKKFGRKSDLESFEDIEILRFFEWDKDIRLVETQFGSLAIDTPEDIEGVELALKKSHGDKV